MRSTVIQLPFLDEGNIKVCGKHALMDPVISADPEMKDFSVFHYTNLVCSHGSENINYFDYIGNDTFFTDENIFEVASCVFPNIVVQFETFDLVSFVKSQLRHGYYVLILFDAYFHPQSVFFQSQHQEMEYLLYGYDEVKECFDTYGMIRHPFCETFMLRYDMLLQQVERNDGRFILIKKNTYTKKIVDSEQIRKNVFSFFNSQHQGQPSKEDLKYGLEAVRTVLHMFPILEDWEKKRYLSRVIESKKSLLKRLCFLSKTDDVCLQKYVELLIQFEKIYRSYMTVSNVEYEKEVIYVLDNLISFEKNDLYTYVSQLKCQREMSTGVKI